MGCVFANSILFIVITAGKISNEAGNVMTIVRLTLLAASVISLISLSILWFVSDHAGDVIFYIVCAFLIANILYLSVSSPKFNSSDIFHRASTWLALASLELQHRSNEAKKHEAEGNMIRDLETNMHKRQAAQEFMSYIRNNPTIRKHFDIEFRQASLPASSNRIDFTAIPQSRSS